MSILINNWLTDKSIKAYYELLTTKVITNDGTFLMEPVISLAVKHLDELYHMIKDLNLADKS